MNLKEFKCPFCGETVFRDLDSCLLPRSKISLCSKCIARGLEERQYKEPEPEDELKDAFFNPSQRKTSEDELNELKEIIKEEYLKEKGREPSESEMSSELQKWKWMIRKDE
jgi:hypothetical protein